MSAGEIRKQFTARAIAQGSRVLLMDEPFTGVNTATEQDIMNSLYILIEQGIIILLATHDLERASREFDRMLLLKRHLLHFYFRSDSLQFPSSVHRLFALKITKYHYDNA